MRVMIKIEIPVERGNAAMRDGSLGKTIQAILEEQKPEAAYFTDSNGMRSGLLFVDLKDASKIPALAEPWFLALNAKVEFKPVMLPADLTKAEAAIKQAVKKYG
jgi:hypothetical protein